MKIGTFLVIFMHGEPRCQNGLIIKVLKIPYFFRLVANFQNWLSVLFLGERAFVALLTFASMVMKNMNMCVLISLEIIVIYIYFLQLNCLCRDI